MNSIKINGKRILSAVLAFAIVLAFMPAFDLSASAAATVDDSTFMSRLADAQSRFKQGEYFAGNDGTGSNLTRTSSVRLCNGTNAKGTTCASVGYCAYGGWCTCSCGTYYYGGAARCWQCWAFACQVGYDIFGVDSFSGWNKHKDASAIKAGDIVRFSWSSSYQPHSIFVIKVVNGTVYYADNNASGPCQVNWNNSRSVSNIQALLNNRSDSEFAVYHAPNSAVSANPNSDTTAPTISNIQITNVDGTGYTVSCTVTDNVGVDRVQFPTWTDYNAQDDLMSEWTTNTRCRGTKNGNTYTYRVNICDHNNEYGTYITHIYAWDTSGNVSCERTWANVKQIDTPALVNRDTYGNSEYYYYTGWMPWTTAKEWCENNGGHLVTVTSSEENEFVLGLTNRAVVWLGLTDKNTEGTWEWVTGETFNYSDWNSGEPNNDGNEDYAGYNDLGKWNDFPDSANVTGFVMEIDKPVLVNSGTYESSKYYYYSGWMPWNRAEQWCEFQGGHLATITSSEENAFVLDLVNGSNVWLGFTDANHEGTWEWVTGEPFNYSDWGDGQPDNSSNWENYGGYCGMKWNDYSMSYFGIVGFVMEIDEPTLINSGTYNNSEYYYYSGWMPWTITEEWCENHGGHLVTITNSEENAFILDLVSGSTVWLGLSDAKTEGTWEWVTGETFSFADWYTGEPSSTMQVFGDEDYVGLYHNSQWNDYGNYSHTVTGFVLEKDTATDTDSNTDTQTETEVETDTQTEVDAKNGIVNGYYYENDVIVKGAGIVEIDGNYYYIGSKGQVFKGTVSVGAAKTNGLIAAGVYTFGADGKMIIDTDTETEAETKNGIVNGYYYENGVIVKGAGIVQSDNDYYYIGSKGQVFKGTVSVATDKTNGLVSAGTYTFDDDGKMVISNGPRISNGYYYEDNAIVKGAGMVKVDGDYYYIGSKGQVFKGTISVTAAKANDLVVPDTYEFGDDGKMVTRNNGKIANDYYYEDGELVKGAGIVEIGGYYYFINSKGKVFVGTISVAEAKTNGLVNAGTYEFGEDGRMVIDNSPKIVNGLYYVNNAVVKGAGVVEVNGNLYYIGSRGQVFKGTVSISAAKTNGLIAAGTYTFDANGVLVQ